MFISRSGESFSLRRDSSAMGSSREALREAFTAANSGLIRKIVCEFETMIPATGQD